MDDFHVYQFYVGGLHERATLEPVGEHHAVKRAAELTQTLGARIGSTCRILITDRDDYVVWEWRYGEGLILPAL